MKMRSAAIVAAGIVLLLGAGRLALAQNAEGSYPAGGAAVATDNHDYQYQHGIKYYPEFH